MQRVKAIAIGIALLLFSGAASAQTVKPQEHPEAVRIPIYMVKAHLQRDREFKLKYSRLVRGDPYSKEIALTFDDGPHPDFTPKLLEVLRKQHVPATFFVVGKMVDKHPELVQQEVADGHEVANHTYNHYRLIGLDRRTVEDELTQGSEAIRRAIGQPSRLFRPPGGEYDRAVTDVARRLHLIMVLWTDDPGDYLLTSPDLVTTRLDSELSDGGIILLHDGIPATLEALPKIIEKWKRRGYKFVTCSQMASNPAAIIDGGPVVLPTIVKPKTLKIHLTRPKPIPVKTAPASDSVL